MLLSLTGCYDVSAAPLPTETAPPPTSQTFQPFPTVTPTIAQFTLLTEPSPTISLLTLDTPTPLPTATPTPQPTVTPPPPSVYDQFASLKLTPLPIPVEQFGLTIDELSARSYGGDGSLTLVETLADRQGFMRYLFTYPSDDLTIYGFMNVPKTAGPHPVAVVLHGHLPPELYHTETYTRRYADALARAGYLVLHPNMRGFYPSDHGMDWFRVGVAIDVLNLIALTRQTAGQPGPLEQADASFIGLMGHSMGGGAALRVATIDAQIDATVLYASMSGNERWNYEKILRWSGGQFGQRELATADETLNQISPIFFLDRIHGPISIHNGEADGGTLKWGVDLCERFQAIEHPVDCFTYPNQPHIFEGDGDRLLTERMLTFFNQALNESQPSTTE